MTDEPGSIDSEDTRLRLEGLNRVADLLSGSATERDAADLVRWRGESPAHEAAFRSALRMRRVIQATGAPPAGGNVVPMRRQNTRRGFIGGAIAASVAVGVLTVERLGDLVPSAAALAADYRTGPGERRLVRLDAGGSVELNTRTSIDVRHDLAVAAAELVSGEALVTSAAGGAIALVAGRGISIGRSARFNVRLDEAAGVCITCLAGLVEVIVGGERRRLEHDGQLRYDRTGIAGAVRHVDAAAVAAWKAGTLIFRNMALASVVYEINRYRPGRVILTNQRLSARSLSGTYDVGRLDEFFDQVRLGFGVKVTRLPGNIVLLS